VRRLVACAGMAAAAIQALSWAAPAHASAWCGTPARADRTPNLVAGYPVRLAYLVPADGEDRVDAAAPTIQADTETIDSWWRTHDPARTVRFDLAPFVCGPQLDLWSLRMPESGAALAEPGATSRAVARALGRVDSGWGYAKYLVYYDGPVADATICGEADNPDEAPGFALVFLRACRPYVSTATVAAHELLHALGAVHPSAPHSCMFPSYSHTCDDERDIMFPYVNGSPLASMLLDAGRDDYYGHSGAWYDVRKSDWLVRLDRQLSLSVRIVGAGSVKSDVPGLSCATSCTTSWNASMRLTLTAKPARGMRLVRWTGACATAMRTCTLTLGRAARLSAVFAPNSRRRR
jgi:hypothetical protein